jgi:hypothetical protein
VIVVVFAYVAAQGLLTGFWGYERLGGLNLYGRVATFVDCSQFTPPKGTAFLCPSEPLAHRGIPNYFEYGASSPVYRHGPLTEPENAVFQRFSVAAIEHEPIAYVGIILRGLTYYITPRFGEGYTPDELREELLNWATIGPEIALYYPDCQAYTSNPRAATYHPHCRVFPLNSGSNHALVAYERDTRVQGPLLVILLLAAIVGAPLLKGRVRWAAILFTLTAVFSATFAVAGNSYDARYAYPTLGPLAAGAALGAWGIAIHLKRIAQRRSSGR